MAYANYIEIPGAPVSNDPDEWLFNPVETMPALHHTLICEALQRCMGRPHGRLMLFMPPGSAKSTYASVVAPTWYMGKLEDRRIILASYGDDLARRQGRKARQIVRSRRYQSLFRTQLSGETGAADEWGLLNGSEYLAAGILSGVTGNRAHGLIIDDPVKNREEARSETVMDKTWDEFRFSLLSRLIPTGWVVLIQTRWSPIDLAGRLLPDDYDQRSGIIRCKDGNDWEVLCLQAKCERDDDPLGRAVGEYLWPEWFDAQHWAQFEIDPVLWEPLYQQRPTSEAGNFFTKDMFRFYREPPPRAQLKIYGTSDYAVSEDHGDWTVHLIWGIDADWNVYLLDYWRARTLSTTWVDMMFELHARWRTFEWVEEKGQIERGLGPFIEKEIMERRAYTLSRTQYAISWGSKEVRAQSFRGYLLRGKVMFPDPSTHPWVMEMIGRMLMFPIIEKLDDEVDACALLGLHLDMLMKGARPPAKPKPEKKLPRGARVYRVDEYEETPPSRSIYRSR